MSARSKFVVIRSSVDFRMPIAMVSELQVVTSGITGFSDNRFYFGISKGLVLSDFCAFCMGSSMFADL